MNDTIDDASVSLRKQAYAAMGRGELTAASSAFAELLEQAPDDADYHYMRGLAHKYLLDWPGTLHHNLRAIELMAEVGQAEHWNAAIAATGLGDWPQARRLWTACGVRVPEGDGPIDNDYGLAVIRLNPWHSSETVWARRIDPVRARLLNVPLPESGHRFGDIVLHDGAPTGKRLDGDGRKVSVFNELGRLQPSAHATYVAFVECPGPSDARALLEATAPGVGFAEDWTASVLTYCMRCSYGAPHSHDLDAAGGWGRPRNIGIAAQSRRSAERLLDNWVAADPRRRVDGLECREVEPPAWSEGGRWWIGPDEASGDPA